MNRKRPDWSFACLAVLIVGLSSGCSSLVNWLAFHPDTINTVDSSKLSANIREQIISTSDGEQLRCFLLPRDSSARLLIYFHGNASNIDQRLPELEQFRSLGVSVLGVGFRGYGKSTGTPSEDGIYRDGSAAIRFAIDSLGYTVEELIVCGRSLGTTVALDVAQDRQLAGLVLITPLSSGKEMGDQIGLWLPLVSPFDNLAKIERLTAPLLILHGSADEITPFAMGKQLFEAAPVASKRLEVIENGLHNNLEYLQPKQYWGAIDSFLDATAR